MGIIGEMLVTELKGRSPVSEFIASHKAALRAGLAGLVPAVNRIWNPCWGPGGLPKSGRDDEAAFLLAKIPNVSLNRGEFSAKVRKAEMGDYSARTYFCEL